MKGKGPIAILLLFCFSVVLVHGMVPHHHHHGVVAESSASCCDEHHNHHDPHNDHDQFTSDAHPHHCDAFNEIAFYKTSDSRIDAPQVLNNLFLAAPYSDMLQIADRSTDPGYFVPRTIQHTTCPGGRTTSLRGPPSTARILA